MRKARILLMLGIWVAILPYLGFPFSWKNVLFTFSGLVLCYFAYVLYREFKAGEIKEKKSFDNFSENQNFSEDEKIGS